MDKHNGSAVQSDNQSEKSFVRQDGQAIIVCPACRKVSKVGVDHFPSRKTRLKVRCACSHTFAVSLDYRQSFRRDTNLVGTYNIVASHHYERMARIKNISFDGLCLEADSTNGVQEGQEGRIEFTLDDKKKTPITKEFLIQSVSGNLIGCKFKNEQAYEKELGFYLRMGS